MMEGLMIMSDIEALGVQERVLLFCLASGTDWKQAGITLKAVAGIVGAGVTLRTEAGRVGKALLRPACLVMPTPGGALALTDAGRVALRVLLRDL
jgi:hypothetical protein